MYVCMFICYIIYMVFVEAIIIHERELNIKVL